MVVKAEERIGLVVELLCSWAVAVAEEPKPIEAVAVAAAAAAGP